MKSIHNFAVERLDGTRYDLGEMDIFVSSFQLSSPSFKHYTEEVEGRNGFIDFGTTYGGRSIKTKLTLLPVDSIDFELLRDEVYKIFNSLQPFYVIPENSTQRFKVKVSSEYGIERTAWDMGETDFELISDIPFSESIGTSLSPMDIETEVWSFGQGLELEEYEYTHTTPSFSIYNPSDTPINPRELPLKITFTGASDNLKITNTTTGDYWQFLGTSTAGQVIILDGIRFTKGGLSIFGQTNRKLITLEQGLNNFTIEGATDPFEISFDFRLYKL
jgi:phage-related protein